MKRILFLKYLLLFAIVIYGQNASAQSNAVGLKKITSELKKIAGSSKFLYYENDALTLINKGKNTYKYSNEQAKTKDQYDKFLEAESQIKEVVKKIYLGHFEQDKLNLLAETIPGNPQDFESESARHLIAFAVDPSIEKDVNSLEEYSSFLIKLNNLYRDAQNGIKQEHIVKFNTINSQFKKNKYYKEVDIKFEESICNNNQKHLESFKLNIQWIAEHVENGSRPLNDIKERFSESENIAEFGFINNSCLNGYSYSDTLTKYAEKIANFNKKSDKPIYEHGLITDDPKRIDCSCAKKMWESAQYVKLHYSKGMPTTTRLYSEYINGIGEEYLRYYRDAITEEAQEFYDANFEVLAKVMYDMKLDIKSSGHPLAVAFILSDMKARTEKMCENPIK